MYVSVTAFIYKVTTIPLNNTSLIILTREITFL